MVLDPGTHYVLTTLTNSDPGERSDKNMSYSVGQKGLCRVARIVLQNSVNGQLAVYGLAELLAALCLDMPF